MGARKGTGTRGEETRWRRACEKVSEGEKAEIFPLSVACSAGLVVWKISKEWLQRLRAPPFGISGRPFAFDRPMRCQLGCEPSLRYSPLQGFVGAEALGKIPTEWRANLLVPPFDHWQPGQDCRTIITVLPPGTVGIAIIAASWYEMIEQESSRNDVANKASPNDAQSTIDASSLHRLIPGKKVEKFSRIPPP